MQKLTLTLVFTNLLPWCSRDNGSMNCKLPQPKLTQPLPTPQFTVSIGV